MTEKGKIETKDCKNIDSFVRKMMRNNQIPGLIVNEQREDFEQNTYKDLKNIKEKLGREIRLKDIEKIYNKLYEIKKSLENYMIGEEFILLDLDHIYMNSRGEIFFIGSFERQKEDIKGLYLQIIGNFIVDYKNEAEKFLDISNYFNRGDYNLELLLDIFFTNPIQKHKSIVEYKKTVRKELNEGKEGLLEKTFLSTMKSLFTNKLLTGRKKDYKERSLNISLRLPKK